MLIVFVCMFIVNHLFRDLGLLELLEPGGGGLAALGAVLVGVVRQRQAQVGTPQRLLGFP